MIFNDINLKDYVKVEHIRKPFIPPITSIVKEIPQKIGSKFIRNKLEPIYIEVDIRLIETDKYEVFAKARELAGLLYTKEPKKLITDEPDKYYMAILDGNTDFEKMLYTGFTTLVFIATDPIAYGDTKIIDIIANPTNNNAGTYKTKGTITIDITEAVDHIQVTLQDTGEYIYLEDDFIVGDIILIDLENEYVTKNDLSLMTKLHLESDFFNIPVGEFEISVSSGDATLEYIERWL